MGLANCGVQKAARRNRRALAAVLTQSCKPLARFVGLTNSSSQDLVTAGQGTEAPISPSLFIASRDLTAGPQFITVGAVCSMVSSPPAPVDVAGPFRFGFRARLARDLHGGNLRNRRANCRTLPAPPDTDRLAGSLRRIAHARTRRTGVKPVLHSSPWAAGECRPLLQCRQAQERQELDGPGWTGIPLVPHTSPWAVATRLRARLRPAGSAARGGSLPTSTRQALTGGG
jgi:hypothetical protein